MENVVFHCLVGEGKWGRQKTREKVFSPGPTFFILPNREENQERKVLWKHFYTNILSHLPSFMTWWPSHLPHLMTFAHKSSLSLLPLLILPSQHTNVQRSRFLFFFFSTWPNQLNFYVHYCNFYILIIKIIT